MLRASFPISYFAATTVLVLAPSTNDLFAQADEKKLAVQARRILEKQCYQCHGKDGRAEGGMNFIWPAFGDRLTPETDVGTANGEKANVMPANAERQGCWIACVLTAEPTRSQPVRAIPCWPCEH